MYHIFSIHSSLGGYLGCFFFLFPGYYEYSSHDDWILIEKDLKSSGHTHKSSIAGSYSKSIFRFLSNLYTDIHSDCTGLNSPHQ